MSGDELRDQGIAAAKAGRKEDARKLLTQAAQLNPRDTQAWLFLASVTDDKKARLFALRRVLEIDPVNTLAIAAVKALGIDPEKLLATIAAEPPPAPTPPPAAPATPPPASGIRSLGGPPSTGASKPPTPPGDELDDLLGGDFAALGDPKAGLPTQADLDALFGGESTPAAPSGPKKLQTLGDKKRVTEEVAAVPSEISRTRVAIDTSRPGVPMPDPEFVAQAIKDVDYLAKSLLGQMSNISADWVKKEKGRAGEADIWRLRAQIWGTVGAFIITLVIIAAIVLSTPDAQRIVFGRRTLIPSRTPSNTPTFTPGFTPTPTATLDSTRFPTYTPSPEIPRTLSPVGRPNATPRATPRYLPVPLDGGLPGAVTLLDRGRILDALPTLDAELNIVSAGNYSPNAYYWDGIALARAGKFSEALNVLTEGETRLEGDTTATDRPQFKALIDLGFAEYELLRGLDLLERGEAGNAAAAFEVARQRAQTALDFDARYAQGYLIIAKTWQAERNPEEALNVLDAPYLLIDRIPEFGVNIDFVVERGDVYLLRAEMRDAAGDISGRRADLEAANYQGYYTVYMNPYDRRGHEMRILTALELGRPGDAVLANDTYRLYFPDDTRALRLLGDARVAEGNTDLALGSFAAALDADLRDADGVAGPDSADILAERAKVYLNEGEFAAALNDLNTALNILPERGELQALRMEAAYAAGEFEIALADSRALFNSGVAPNDVFKLMEARVLVTTSATADPETRRIALQDADDALDFVGANLPANLRAVAGEVRAEVLLERGFPADAVAAADETLELVNSPRVRLIRGQAWEAQFNLVNARRDYQRVLADTQDIDEDLALSAREGLERVAVSSTATSTAVTATAVVEQTSTAQARMTATQAALESATANAFATETAEAELDATAEAGQEITLTPSPTRTPTDTDESTPRPTLTPSRTPNRTPTPGGSSGDEEVVPTP